MLLNRIYFCCIIPDYGSAYADTTLKMSTPEQKDHVVYSSWFPIGKRVTDHRSFLAPEAIGFSQELLPPRT